ncbi:MAG: signal peptide peptidase SppA [Rickettsiales bacterium]
MALSSDSLIERTHLKRQLTFWRIFAVGVAVLFLVILIERNAKIVPSEKDEPYIARAKIENIIGDNAEQQDFLRGLESDDKIKAVILYLDTPGGSAAGGETIKKLLENISKKKPVVVSMRSVCASAGYMISLGADRVYALDGTLTGSIGVILESADFSELAQKIGVKPVVIKSGRYKDIMSPTRPMTEDERAILQESIDSFYNAFVDMIVEARKIPREEILKIADGRVFSGRQAKALGLVDAIGGEEEALAWLHKERGIDSKLEVKDVEIKDKFDKFLDKLSEYAGIAPLSSLTWRHQSGLVAIWDPSLTLSE